MSNFLDVACEVAKSTGNLIMRNRDNIKDISFKSEINLGTDVDKKAEEHIMSILYKRFPKHSFLAEERGGVMNGSPYRWIIDPIDGTTNFAHGFPFYSVSIALEYNSEIILGVVYDPVRREIFTAEKGRGSFLNNKSISVSDTASLKESMVATGFSYDFKRARDSNLTADRQVLTAGKAGIENFVKFLMNSQAVRRAGSAAIDLCYVACGRFDGFWECDLHPWDTAAGWLIVKEAKGRVTKFNGDKYSCFDKEILASNGKIHNEMMELLA